jgi:hypothetical protein
VIEILHHRRQLQNRVCSSTAQGANSGASGIKNPGSAGRELLKINGGKEVIESTKVFSQPQSYLFLIIEFYNSNQNSH